MIRSKGGDLLQDDAQALVNTVNTVGVMGRGLAAQVKDAYPSVFAEYVAACRTGNVQPGRILPVQIGADRWILNFPTKRHWRNRSRLTDIEAGLEDLIRVVRELQISSIAIPPLGCGLGGLDWAIVRPLIVERLAPLDLDVRLYEPTRTA
ncbi:hypothetical protein GCM10029978_066990 [Actinoallomurus acanthiterrae]